MSLLSWLKDMLFWKRQIRETKYECPLNKLDLTSQMLSNTVKETSDISQRLIKKLESIEEQLEDREELLDVIFCTIPDFLLLKDGNGCWRMLNSYGKKLYGISNREYKGKNDYEIARELSPRYFENLEICRKTDEEAWHNRRATSFEEESTDSFGHRYIFDVVKTPIFNDDGSRKYLLVHGRNITEHIENNKHISMLIKALNHASDSIVVTDHEHRIVYANEAFCDKYGFELPDILMKPANICASGQTSQAIYEQMHESINKGNVWSGIVSNKTKTGEVLLEVLTITPVMNGKPYPVYFIGVKRPVDRRKHPREHTT